MERPERPIPEQPDAPEQAEQRGIGTHAPDTPGFHAPSKAEQQPKSGPAPASPASLRPDADTDERADTGTGDQPSNTGGSRTGTPPGSEERK